MKTYRLVALFIMIALGPLAACGGAQTVVNVPPTQVIVPTDTLPPAPIPTHTPLPTDIPEPSPTPTHVPTDTAEPIPAKTDIPGWEKFEAQGVEIWLPESFEGGDLENDLDLIVEKLNALGPEFEQVAAMIEANPTAFVLWAFDTEIGSSGYLTNMNITHEKVLSAVTLEMYIQAVSQQLPSYLTISQQEPGNLEQYDSYRLVIDTDVSGVKGNELLYVIKDGSDVWAIAFATSVAEFDARLPVFEQSVQSFATQP